MDVVFFPLFPLLLPLSFPHNADAVDFTDTPPGLFQVCDCVDDEVAGFFHDGAGAPDDGAFELIVNDQME